MLKYPMKTFDEISAELKLTPEQKTAVEAYFNQLIVELLESIKQDNNQNFDETISSISLKS
jgi:hypothetical protein